MLHRCCARKMSVFATTFFLTLASCYNQNYHPHIILQHIGAACFFQIYFAFTFSRVTRVEYIRNKPSQNVYFQTWFDWIWIVFLWILKNPWLKIKKQKINHSQHIKTINNSLIFTACKNLINTMATKKLSYK